MTRIILFVLLLFHGIIHIVGLMSSMSIIDAAELTNRYNYNGIAWATVGLIFIVSGFAVYRKQPKWFVLALIALLLSQALILAHWDEAKYGSIINFLVLLISLAAMARWNFMDQFHKDYSHSLQRQLHTSLTIVKSADLERLPQCVRKYLDYVGVVGTPYPQSMHVRFSGKMRSKTRDWFNFNSDQYNFFDIPERYFFMKGIINGIPFYGYHEFDRSCARMRIKPLGIFSIVNLSNRHIRIADTVTYFNDLCIMAPAALMDPRIVWITEKPHSATARFEINGISIRATLHFNKQYQLIDFTSDDRIDLDGKKYTFSTPVGAYRKIGPYHLPTKGEAIWHYPEGAFTYGRFELQELAYNGGEKMRPVENIMSGEVQYSG